jgi:hypothetical protein
MHIQEVIQRAWKITWRYKILWLFGLFAAEASSGGSANFNTSSINRGSSGTNPVTGNAMAGLGAFRSAMAQAWPLIVGMALFFIVLGIAWWIVSVAARGGLVRMVNDGDEGRPVKAADGWSAGFHYWGRVFLQQIVFGLPIFLVVVVIGGLFALLLGGTIVPLIQAARAGGGQARAVLGSRILGLVAGSCGLFLIAFVVLLVLGILYFVWVPLSLRFAILYDRPAIKAIGDGWNLLRARLGKVALAGVVIWGLRFVYGIVVGIFSLLFLLPVAGFALARIWFVAGAMGFVWLVLVVFAGAVFSAFYSAYWTIAFRRIMDLGPDGASLVAGPDAAIADAGAGAGYLPDAPAPPAPPVPAAVAVEPVIPPADLGAGHSDELITQAAGDGSALPDVPTPLPAQAAVEDAPAVAPAEPPAPEPPAPPAVPKPPRRSDLPKPPATLGSEE